MRLIRVPMQAYLYLSYGLRRLTGSGPFGVRRARYLDGPLPGVQNNLKQALAKYHVRQYHASSCSVASVVTAVNALNALNGRQNPPVDQLEILEEVRTAHWKERMSTEGYKGRRGLPLKCLGAVVQTSLDVYGLDHKQLVVVQAAKNRLQADRQKTELYQRLSGFEKHGNGLIIAHFGQGTYVPALNIPHISPVGAFDPDTGRVTILDVDPDQPNPYQIDFTTFYKGLACNYHHIFKPFGYGRGGYIYIQLR